MKLIKRTYRIWWKIPRRVGDREEDRRVTFLELFSDLVYVVMISIFSHDFANDLTFSGLIHFCSLFTVVWWSWTNGMLYHELHSNEDVKIRVYTFIQMACVIVISIFAHDALQSNFVGFALSYSFLQIVLSIFWWRTGVHDPEHRLITYPYVTMLVLNGLLFGLSVFVTRDIGYILWIAGMVISFIAPFVGLMYANFNKEVKQQFNLLSKVSPSLIERMGLLTIIVLGEVVVSIVSGGSGIDVSIGLAFRILFSICITIGLWWVYFDYISARRPSDDVCSYYLWTYAHFPIIVGIVITGCALQNIIHGGNHLSNHSIQVILISSILITLFCVALIIRSLVGEKPTGKLLRNGQIAIVVSMVFLSPFLFVPLNTYFLLGVTVIGLAIPSVMSFVTYIYHIDPHK